jgi:hypothetical protein
MRVTNHDICEEHYGVDFALIPFQDRHIGNRSIVTKCNTFEAQYWLVRTQNRRNSYGCSVRTREGHIKQVGRPFVCADEDRRGDEKEESWQMSASARE